MLIHGTDMLPARVQQLIELAATEAALRADFLVAKGPGVGDRSTSEFMAALKRKAESLFGPDVAEREVVKRAGVRVDYWFEPEATIIEIALGLKNPLSEFERDVLKAVVARHEGRAVTHLVLVGKPGAVKRATSPWYQRVIEWAKSQGVEVTIADLPSNAAA